jgi:branched-chain amino acid aminotransferase
MISPDNRSFRYGDGFFETMKLVNGKIVLEDYAYGKIVQFTGADAVSMPDYFTPAYFREHVLELAQKELP